MNNAEKKRKRGRPFGSGSAANPNHTIFKTQILAIDELASKTGLTPSHIHRLALGFGLAELSQPKVLAELIRQTKA